MEQTTDTYIGKRFEFKYVLSHKEAAELQNYIEKVGLLVDANSGAGGYVVNSMYFDTPFLDDYRDKDGSLLVRKKMRARMYNDSWFAPHEAVWLEIKAKRDFNINKSRIKVSGSSWESFMRANSAIHLLDNNVSAEDREKLRKYVYLYDKGRYEPNVIVKYKRAAYLDRFTDKIRVTFDRDIESCFAKEGEEQFMTPIFPDKTIMEVKFIDKLPWWFAKATDIFDIRRQDFSKYNHSVATLRDFYRIPVSR